MDTLLQKLSITSHDGPVYISVVASCAAASDQVFGLSLFVNIKIDWLDIWVPYTFLVFFWLWFWLHHFDLCLFDSTFDLLLLDGSQVT